MQPIDISRLIIQTLRSGPQDLQSKCLKDPVRKHIHTSNGPASRPDVAVDDPLLLLRPLDLGILPHGLLKSAIIHRCVLTVQQSRARESEGTSTSGEKQLAGFHMPFDELNIRLRKLEASRIRATENQDIHLRRFLDGDSPLDPQTRAHELQRLGTCTDVVEDDFRRGIDRGLRHGLFDVHGEEGLAAVHEEVERAENVGGLVVVDHCQKVRANTLVGSRESRIAWLSGPRKVRRSQGEPSHAGYEWAIRCGLILQDMSWTACTGSPSKLTGADVDWWRHVE